ncbi:hypothetical protein BSL78_25462 [Apostichopus japonicus]|uniref:Kringle domain-containing protein n=1 Tax=Stichopus japonicus TaxID=307972 RepID=A0A2G8JPL6_STIJA|nr:hypothetical protein BSL78_25462 [Apostichopus japonicus]
MKVHQLLVVLLHVAASWTSVSGINRADPAFQTFMANLIEQFQELAFYVGRQQFAVVVMISQQELADWNVNYQPSDASGNPLIDWSRPLSPSNQNQYVNFIVAVPNHIGEHSERQIMPHLGQLLQRFRITHDNQNPAAIILYTRICPCQDCTDDIIHSFHELNLPPQVERGVIYTTAGDVPGVDSDYAWTRLTAYAFVFFRFAVTQGQCRPRQFKLGLGELHEVNDCRPLQTYLLDKFGESLEGCVSSTESGRATADLINRLMASCSLELGKLDICLERNVKVSLGSYCAHANGVATAARLSRYMKQVMQSSTNNLDLHFVSMPLDPSNPTQIMDAITSRDQLQSYDKSVTYSCKDNRQRGLMCSTLRTNYLTAGRSICKQDYPCDYRSYSYSWCYLETGSWDYCCTENCLDGWCKSGTTYRQCTGDIGYVTAGNTVCRTDSPCGLHGNEYSWCYTDYSWEYCCTDECGYKSYGYQWCQAGNTWEYCGRYYNGQGLSNVKNVDCLPDHQCGKHAAYSYKYWCYTDSRKNWDYCCIPGCPCGTYSYSYWWCYTGESKDRWDYCNI